jgi:hypothetical protein
MTGTRAVHEITLRITVNPDLHDEPTEWDWAGVLDVSPDEVDLLDARRIRTYAVDDNGQYLRPLTPFTRVPDRPESMVDVTRFAQETESYIDHLTTLDKPDMMRRGVELHGRLRKVQQDWPTDLLLPVMTRLLVDVFNIPEAEAHEIQRPEAVDTEQFAGRARASARADISASGSGAFPASDGSDTDTTGD